MSGVRSIEQPWFWFCVFAMQAHQDRLETETSSSMEPPDHQERLPASRDRLEEDNMDYWDTLDPAMWEFQEEAEASLFGGKGKGPTEVS